MSNPDQDLSQISKVQICILCQREVTGDHPVCPFDGGPLITKRPDRMLGKKIAGKYEVEKILSRGGMGVIYRARHLLLDRPVAIKCIAEALTYDPTMWKRFDQEAKNASLLNHPHIITIHDFGVTEEGDLYLVMEYLEGASLNDFIELNGQLNERACARIFLQVCEALAHAHKAGILHRDLKPTNIFISSTPQGPHVKVLDFGLAKAMVPKDTNREKITRSGECLGTPNYMSPEQVRNLEVDQRSDVYALGVCMFEALTGKLPFSSDDMMQILSMQISQKPPSFFELVPQKKIDKEIEAIVMKCLEKDLQKRFKSMSELSSALQKYLNATPPISANGASKKNSRDSRGKGDDGASANAPRNRERKDSPVSDNDDNTVVIKYPSPVAEAKNGSPAKKNSGQDQFAAETPPSSTASGRSSSSSTSNKPADSSSTASLPSKVSRLSARSAKALVWGFLAAALLALGTATQVLMPAKKEAAPAAAVRGVLYHYGGSGEDSLAELNVDGHTIKFLVFDKDAVKIKNIEGLQNGAVWNCSYHQGASGLELDSAQFSGAVDPLVRDADALVRRHYGQLGRKQWQAAYDNIAPGSGLRKSSFEEFKKGFKYAFHNPDSELAPAGASKIVSVDENQAVILVDIAYFSKGSGYYSFQLLRNKGRWLIDSVKAISPELWRQG